MTENGAERDADGQYPPGDPDKFALARRKLHRSSPRRKVLGDRNEYRPPRQFVLAPYQL
jgi:hypothetical protein